MNTHTEKLKQAFAAIGVSITDDEVPQIIAHGADSFLSQRKCSANEEDLTGIYILLTEMKSPACRASELISNTTA